MVSIKKKKCKIEESEEGKNRKVAKVIPLEGRTSATFFMRSIFFILRQLYYQPDKLQRNFCNRHIILQQYKGALQKERGKSDRLIHIQYRYYKLRYLGIHPHKLNN